MCKILNLSFSGNQELYVDTLNYFIIILYGLNSDAELPR